MLKRIFFFFLFFFLITPIQIFAATGGDLKIDQSDIRFSKETLVVGDTVRVYARIYNIGKIDVLGYLTFFQGNTAIKEPQVISILANGSPEEVYVDFEIPDGAFNIRAEVSGTQPSDVNITNNTAITKMYQPVFDEDKDGVSDSLDNCKSIANNDQQNTDQDLLGNACDDDDDNDSLSDVVEQEIQSNPLVSDTDSDGVSDFKDAYPTDKTQSVYKKQEPKTLVVKNPETQVQIKNNEVQNKLTTPVILLDDQKIEEIKKTDEKILLNKNSQENELREAEILTMSAEVIPQIIATKKTWATFEFQIIPSDLGDYYVEWDLGDGVRSSKKNVIHTYQKSGSYNITLKTINNNGDIHQSEIVIQIPFFDLSNPVIRMILVLCTSLVILSCLCLICFKFIKRSNT